MIDGDLGFVGGPPNWTPKKHSPRFLGNPIQAQKTMLKNLLHEENKSADEHAPYHGMSNSCLSISRDAPGIVYRKEGCEAQCWGTMWKTQWKTTWKLRLCKVDVAFLVVNAVVPKQEYARVYPPSSCGIPKEYHLTRFNRPRICYSTGVGHPLDRIDT